MISTDLKISAIQTYQFNHTKYFQHTYIYMLLVECVSIVQNYVCDDVRYNAKVLSYTVHRI